MASTPLIPEMPGYHVQAMPGARAIKTYVCPGCAGPIVPGESHVVAWPEGLPDDRRHWHRHCWRLETRRGRIG